MQPKAGGKLHLRLNTGTRSEEHTSELQSLTNLVCRLLLEKKKINTETMLIADRSYRIRIHPKDAAVVSKTVKTINEKLKEFKPQVARKDLHENKHKVPMRM